MKRLLNASVIKKSFIGISALVVLFSALLWTPPVESRADPVIFSVILGGIGSALGIDAFTCIIDIIWGCDDDQNTGNSGNTGNAAPSQACTSSANTCGMTNNGFIEGGSCNATVPPNSSCPPPAIATNAFYAQPSIVKEGGASTLNWDSNNATACTITSDTGFSHTGGPSGSVSTGPVAQSSTYTLTCKNGDGGPTASASVRVTVTPVFIEI